VQNNIGDILTRRALLSPRQDAYVDAASGTRFSFRELNERCNRTANGLAALGVKPGDRVGLLLMNGVEFMESFFAIAKLGAVVVPLNWRLVADELEFILENSGASVLVFDDAFQAMVTDLHGRGERTAVRTWVQVTDGDVAAFATTYAALQSAATAVEPALGGAEDDMLYIMYTSGTTGLPKGAVHTHNTCLWALLTMNVVTDLRGGDRYLHLLPMFHVGALTPVTYCVYRGATSVIARSFDPVMAWRVTERERVAVMLAVPAMLNFMWQVPNRDDFDRSSLRWIMSGAAPVPVSLIQEYASVGIEILQIYGLTETCGPACVIDAEHAIAKAGSTGKGFFHTDIRIVNDAGEDCAPGEPGEVLVRGRHLMKEYWRRPEATAETIRDGWLHTGDVATLDDEGFVYIMDRTKDMVISGGENIYPAELENVILQHPMVSEVAVIGQPSARWGESPFAVVVRKDPALSEREVLDWCQGRMARFKLPCGATFIDVIPRNPSGKVLKRLLREQFPGPAPQ
jgi:acyl-CoA synthetase (AMP-forming)/AMP-acid ligase II